MLVMRMVLDQFKVKHEGCIVRARSRALRSEEMKAICWSWVEKALHGNKAAIWSLVSCDGHIISESKLVCIELYGVHTDSGMVVDFTSYLSGMQCLSTRDAVLCEIPITAEDIWDMMMSCTRQKSLRRDGLPL